MNRYVKISFRKKIFLKRNFPPYSPYLRCQQDEIWAVLLSVWFFLFLSLYLLFFLCRSLSFSVVLFLSLSLFSLSFSVALFFTFLCLSFSVILFMSFSFFLPIISTFYLILSFFLFVPFFVNSLLACILFFCFLHSLK